MTSIPPYSTNPDDRHPSIRDKFRYLRFEHLAPGPHRDLSEQFTLFARDVLGWLPDDPETTIAIDLIRQAKDRAVAVAAFTYQARPNVAGA